MPAGAPAPGTRPGRAGVAEHDPVRAQAPDQHDGKVREAAGREPEPTAAVVDSQSVKGDAVVGADSRGYDGGKEINGRRRHLICDTIGLLLAIRVTAADVTDRQAAAGMLPALRTPGARSSPR
ncbi:transposase [Streptomyces sp. NPDC006384]|uniref:transposase n=1 Tax=Streptomyces sp. NPDC006384 TaxID=3364745 RepID=UPI00367B7B38